MSACEHYQQQISQLLDGELPPEQVQTLRAHLRTCPECQRVYDGFLALQAAVRDAAAAPPADLTARIMQQVRQEPVPMPPRSAAPAESSADSTTLHISDRKTIEALSALLVRTQPVQPLDADRTPLCVLEETSADGVTTRVTVWCDGKDVVFVSSTDTQYYRVPDAAAEFCRLTGLPEN